MDHDAELDAILEQVEAAGLVEQFTDEDGRPAMRLTPEGVRVARQLAMLGEDGQDALMDALLEDAEVYQRAGTTAGSRDGSRTTLCRGAGCLVCHRHWVGRWMNTRSRSWFLYRWSGWQSLAPSGPRM